MIQGILDHVWQSTLFVGVAYLATLMLRSNRAESRYWVWFAASTKFLIPFSLLVGLGMHLPHRVFRPPIRTEWIAAFQEFNQPLELAPVMNSATVPARSDSRINLAAAWGIWACGFLAVVIVWSLRWRRIHVLRSSAHVVNVPTILPIPVPVMSVPDLVEPGVVGVLRPALLLPEGILERLSPVQLNAILAHEFCHVRRKDNFTAAIHMAVQALFWFHPLTWWIGARLIAEREAACDEEVLREGCSAKVYAESILAVCRLYLSSPLAFVSGVSGSNLKKRIEMIMRNRKAIRLSLGKKLILTCAGLAALVLPMFTGALPSKAFQAQEEPDWETKAGGKMIFEVASVKLSAEKRPSVNVPLDAGARFQPTGGYFRADVPLWGYIQFAYKLWAPGGDERKEMFARLPKWVTTDFYSIEARASGNPTKDQFRLMVRSLLAERFKLAAHFETREMPVLALTLAKDGKLGPKLIPHAEGRPCGDPAAPTESAPAGVMEGKDEAGPQNFPAMCDSLVLMLRPNGTRLAGFRNAPMDQITASLSGVIGLEHPLVDHTGLIGRYDFTLAWALQPTVAVPPGEPAPPEPLGPTAPQALRDQLGLKLESARGPVKILIVDKVERPSEN